MGKYTKYAIGGTLTGLGIGYANKKFNEKSKPSEEDTLVAARNAKLHKLVNQKNRESGASRSSSSEINSRAADLAEKSRKARSEYTPTNDDISSQMSNTIHKANSSLHDRVSKTPIIDVSKIMDMRATVKPHKMTVKPTTMDKLRSAGSHAKDTAKELYGHFSHSPKAQMIAGGTAAALGAGLAAKRYLQRKNK